MKVIRDTIEGTTVFIQTTDEVLEIVSTARDQEGPDIDETGITDKLRAAAYTEAKAIIRGIANDIGAELAQINEASRPKQIQIEFNVGISTQGGVPTIFSTKGDYILKVVMTWEPKA